MWVPSPVFFFLMCAYVCALNFHPASLNQLCTDPSLNPQDNGDDTCTEPDMNLEIQTRLWRFALQPLLIPLTSLLLILQPSSPCDFWHRWRPWQWGMAGVQRSARKQTTASPPASVLSAPKLVTCTAEDDDVATTPALPARKDACTVWCNTRTAALPTVSFPRYSHLSLQLPQG